MQNYKLNEINHKRVAGGRYRCCDWHGRGWSGITFWTFDDPKVVHEKAEYVKRYKLGGMMSWSLDQDDGAFSLSKAMFELR